MRKNLKPQDLGDFLEQAKCATLATHLRDGTVLLSPVWHEWRNSGFTVATSAEDIKARHIQRDPRVSIVIAEDTPPYRGIEVRGQAKIVRNDALATIRRIAIRYLGAEQGAAYIDAVGQGDLVLIRLEPGVLRAWDFTDEF
jgi:PPOX class probable F420-dependent enzyme